MCTSCTKLQEKVANSAFLYVSGLVLTFVLHMGITFSKEEKDTIVLLVIWECFRFNSEHHCL